MSTDLLWAVAIAGACISLVQIFTARRLDLRPLIVGSFALLLVLGVLEVGVNLVGALALLAPPSHAPGALTELIGHLSAAIGGVNAAGIGLLGIGGIGGLAMLLRDLFGASRAPAADAKAEAGPDPAT